MERLKKGFSTIGDNYHHDVYAAMPEKTLEELSFRAEEKIRDIKDYAVLFDILKFLGDGTYPWNLVLSLLLEASDTQEKFIKIIEKGVLSYDRLSVSLNFKGEKFENFLKKAFEEKNISKLINLKKIIDKLFDEHERIEKRRYIQKVDEKIFLLIYDSKKELFEALFEDKHNLCSEVKNKIQKRLEELNKK